MNPSMPPDLQLVGTTPEFTAASVPAGMRSAHQVANNVWGRLCVRRGTVMFTFEDDPDAPIVVAADGHVDIPPARPHHVEPADDAVFVVEFHR